MKLLRSLRFTRLPVVGDSTPFWGASERTGSAEAFRDKGSLTTPHEWPKSTMANDHESNRVLGESVDTSASPFKYSPIATDPLEGEAFESHGFSKPMRHGAWRPFTLRAPTLLLFFFSTVGLIAIVEALNYASIRNKALAFAGPRGEFSMAQIFCYRYLPQMVIVLYGIGWAAVDLDVKRLEPYFQLSKPGGASASDSILLHYPFDFLALVPVTAAKRKHWNVFAAGTALVLIFWVITPLQSSLLTTELVVQEIRTQFVPTAKLETYSRQLAELDSSFLYSSYSVTWLGQEIEGFMTREFVATPFKPANSISERIHQGNESWTAVTRVYQTHLDCVPATVIEPGRGGGGAYKFTTDGCSYSLNPLPDKTATRNLMYIGHGNNNGTAQWYLREFECKVQNIFLGVWGRSRLPSNRSTDIDVSGIFCRTGYSYADAEVTVDATNLRITGFGFVGEPKPLTADDKIIDINIFEQNLGAGSTMDSVDAKHFSTLAPATQVRYEGWNLWSPTGQIGYAIGLENKTFDDFGDPKVFGDAMNKTHKLLFNYAVRALFREDDRPQQVNGTRIVRRDGVIVVPAVAHLLAGFLSAVAVCLGGVFLISYNRPNNLHSDPNTLAAKMSLVAQSPQLLKDFEGADDCPDIAGCIARRHYKLWDEKGGHRLDIADGSDATPSGGSHESSTIPHNGFGIRPWELSVGMGVGATIFSAGLLVLLAVLYRSSQRYSGLPTLSSHQLVVQFIFSFIPTAVATLIEPLWVVITRYLALFQPWTELNRGHSSSAASLGLKYTNLPPVLIAPRALAGGHYILSLASFVVLASNGLTVALGGLFNSGPLPVSAAITFDFPLSAGIDTQIQTKGVGRTPMANVTGTFARDGEEHWLIALTNSTGTPLPPWIAPGFYFLPFAWDPTAGNASDLRSANTRGFGGNLTCELLAGDVYGQQSWAGLSRDPVPRPAIALNVTIPMANGKVPCGNPLVKFSLRSLVTGRFAGEYLYGLEATERGDKEADDFCNSFLVMGWNRGSVTVGQQTAFTPNYTMDTSTYENTTILCAQQIFSAEFNVVVDNNGFVQKFERLTPFTYDDGSLFNNSTTITSFKAQLGAIIRTNPYSNRDTGAMHNDPYPRSLSHYFIEHDGQKALCDPSTPPPPFEVAQQRFQDFYNWFAPIVIGQNSARIFISGTNDGGRKSQIQGKRIYFQNRVSVDPAMFCISTALLGFSALASLVVFAARPKRFLPRLPDSLAAEIGLFYAGRALEDAAGTAHVSSAARERHLATLGWEYGYGRFVGKDGKVHSGVERMRPIIDFKESSEE